MQTYGHDRSVIVMERADPMLLLVSLPLIPVGLIIGQMIRWEETVSLLRCIVTILVSIVVILTVTSIEPILEKCVHLEVQY